MPEQVINIVEIKNLKQLLVKNPNASIPLYNPGSGKVERILVADLVGGETVKVPWVIDQNYMIDEIAEFNNKIWKSLQDNNVGHQPYDDQTWWVEVSPSSANGTALQPWAAGIFNIVNSSVTVNNAGYLLNNSVTLPFNSTDFATELASNIWVALGSGGGGGGHIIADSDEQFPQQPVLKFIGAVNVTNGVGETVVNIPNQSITIDAVPTDGSANAVSSNGVFDALNGLNVQMVNSLIPTVASGEKVVTRTPSAVLVDRDMVEMEVASAGLDALSWSGATATYTGNKGQMAYGASYKYECIGTNTWIRTLIMEQRIDLYLADIDDSGSEKTSAQLDSAYPTAVVGQRVWGTTRCLYEKKDVNLWRKFNFVTA